MLCKCCGKLPRYERNGHVFGICVNCCYVLLMEFLELPTRDAELHVHPTTELGGATLCVCRDDFAIDESGKCSWCHKPPRPERSDVG